MHETILVVDDEPKIVKLARDYLERGGFRVVTAADGITALAVARHERPDMVVLDLNLPGTDGLDVCRALRRESDVPIIMLTARVEETDRLIGLELGADDYITKPFSPRELVARVRAVLRRVQGGVHQPGLIRAGDLEIDLNGHRVTRAREPINLTRTEFNLLAILAQHPGQTFTRAQLLDRLHGIAHEGFDRSIDAHINKLRCKREFNPLDLLLRPLSKPQTDHRGRPHCLRSRPPHLSKVAAAFGSVRGTNSSDLTWVPSTAATSCWTGCGLTKYVWRSDWSVGWR